MKKKETGKKAIAAKITESIKMVLSDQNEKASKKIIKSIEKASKKLAKKFAKLTDKKEKKKDKKTEKASKQILQKSLSFESTNAAMPAQPLKKNQETSSISPATASRQSPAKPIMKSTRPAAKKEPIKTTSNPTSANPEKATEE